MVILRFKLVEQLISAVAQNIVVTMTAVSEENRHNGVEDEHVARARRELLYKTDAADDKARVDVGRRWRQHKKQEGVGYAYASERVST